MPDFPKAYWSEWSEAIINRYSLREGPKGEHHGACPNCGHKDWPSTRFWIHERDGLVKFQCRQCNDFQAIVEILTQALLTAAKISAPILVTAVVVGVVMGLIQSVTQVQEQALAFVPKFLAVGAVIALSGSWMLAQIVALAEQLLVLAGDLAK